MLSLRASLSHSQRVRLEQRLAHLMRIVLRQELRLVLEQLLKLMQSIRQGRAISYRNIIQLRRTTSVLDERDLHNLAHETIRRLSIDEGRALTETLRCVANFDGERFRGVAALHQKLELVLRNRENWRAGERRPMALALRLMLKEPPFFGGATSAADLARLLKTVPQLDQQGRIQWVLGGGWAVELLTGVNLRSHHDIDTIVMTSKPLYLDTDQVHSDDYFGSLSCTRRFMLKRCVTTVEWTYRKQTFTVLVAKPEFLFLSKFVRAPRPQDWEDAKLLIQTFYKTWDRRLTRALLDRTACDFAGRPLMFEAFRFKSATTVIVRLATIWF
jgi:hypothetical protein